MVKILLTGFAPFAQELLNPSWEVARALAGKTMDAGGASACVHSMQLPCVFCSAAPTLLDAVDRLQPQLVVCLGQASGRTDITPERVAINIADARIADNAGAQPIDAPVVAGGPVAYWSTLPIKAIVHALRCAGIPASVSNSAGSYVCNHVFYALLHGQAQRRVRACGGFVHLPLLPQQAARIAGAPSMALEVQLQGIELLLRAALAVQSDT